MNKDAQNELNTQTVIKRFAIPVWIKLPESWNVRTKAERFVMSSQLF